ncbi:pantothenate kinase [Nostoc sp. FACHB-280]|uniref:pantothenate kinase n=1 Tax=Nostoc sp. FACHB-280 TaxID=2692839 RepID=UPI00168AE07D|nr:pantothenate kinase [Nostoc sp. FACHB-280]MBD2495716.1 pantothenate kinase [Nostoc sp. FACHB-280]
MNIHKPWLALEIGNSRLHWGLFVGETLDCTWNTDYLPDSVIQQLGNGRTLDEFPAKIFTLPSPLPLVIASVVPSQTALWQSYPNVKVITLENVPLKNTYPTLGIDRALALWGAGIKLGFPILVIDAGTALTFTGADSLQNLVGGAILPGLGLQFATLGQKTSQLPQLETQNIISLPSRFALNTPEAIQSGVIYTLLAGVKDFMTAWRDLYPNSKVAIKGGDRTLLFNYLQTVYPEITARLIVETNLIFWGIAKVYSLY